MMLKFERISELDSLYSYSKNKAAYEAAYMIGVAEATGDPSAAILQIFNMGRHYERHVIERQTNEEFNNLLNKKEAA